MALVRPTMVTMEEVDDALVSKLSGIQVNTMESGVVSVPVILEDSLPVIEREYPVISIEFQDEAENFDTHEAAYDVYVSGRDTSDPANVSVDSEPEQARLIYQIKVWVKDDIAACRELKQKIRGRLPRRTYLSIPKTQAADVVRTLWMFQEGNTAFLKERVEDELILQHVWSYGILCELATGDSTTTEKAVKAVGFGQWQGVTQDEDVDVEYRSFLYDIEDEEFTPS